MQINKYTAYSMVSLTENKNQNEIQRLFDLIEEFKVIKSHQEAKEYLKNIYGITDSVQNFPIATDGTLNIHENKNKYSVRIFYKIQENQECIVYSFKK